MKELADMDRITLQPGETLILRYRKMASADRHQRDCELIRKTFPNNKVIVLQHDVDVIVANIEVIEPPEEDQPETGYHAEYEAVCRAYEQGRIVQAHNVNEDANDPIGWFDIHRTHNPHKFNRDLYWYRLAPPAREG